RLGLLSPAAFLPLAEEQGLAVDLDLWVLRTASTALAEAMADTSHQADPPYLAVNVSVHTLLDDRLLPAVREARSERDLAPGQLVVELIESRSLIDLPGVVERLTELRRMGVRVSLDDFGTGYSTLTWLHRLPMDQIKIDRSFVAPLPDDASSIALVRGVVALASEIGVAVVAEGVEDTGQRDALIAAGCRHVQGYLYGRPDPSLVRCLRLGGAEA
ncbi:MAG: EAL domain-containing protein, partial [Nitriliruptor sp.]